MISEETLGHLFSSLENTIGALSQTIDRVNSLEHQVHALNNVVISQYKKIKELQMEKSS